MTPTFGLDTQLGQYSQVSAVTQVVPDIVVKNHDIVSEEKPVTSPLRMVYRVDQI